MARYSEAHNKAVQRYIKDYYEACIVRFPKGEKELLKEFIKNECPEVGSMNKFIHNAIENYKKEIMKNK